MTLLRMIAFRPWQEKPIKQSVTASPSEAKTSGSTELSATMPAGMPSNLSGSTSTGLSGHFPDWLEIFNRLDLQAIPRQLAANCQLEAIRDDTVHLILDQAHASILGTGPMQKIEDALTGFFGRPMKVRIQPGIVSSETPMQHKLRQDGERHAMAVESIQQDENVRMMEEMFGATVAVNTIQPIDES